MQRKLSIGLLAAVAALSLVACHKRGPKDKAGAQATPMIWSQLPSSTFFAMAFHYPEKTAPNLRAALTKMGIFADFYKDADLDDLQRDYGIDPFDPASFQAMGVDVSQGVAMGLDGELLATNTYYDDYAAIVRTYKKPALYWVAALSDPAKFNAWLKTSISRDDKLSLVSETQGDLALSLVMSQPYTPTEPKRAEVVVVVRGGYVYAFFVNLQPSSKAELSDPIALFKKDLPAFFARTSAPIPTSPNFQAVARQLNTSGDCMLYMDVAGLSTRYEIIESDEVVFLTPSSEDVKRYQEDERRYSESRKERDRKAIAVIQRLGEAFPAFGMSGALEQSKASCEGYSLVGKSYQDDTRAVLMPSAAAPAYATLFPAGTGFIYRESLNLLALKRLVYRFFSTAEQVEMDSGWKEIADAAQGFLGLDLEKDLVGAFTGHLAFGGPDLSIAVTPFAFDSSKNPRPQLPPAVMIAQLTSAAAGDKIIAALQPMLDMVGVRTEAIDGEKLYYFEADGVEVAWARVNDLMLAGLSRGAVKEMLGNVKKPGVSVVDKLPNELSKSLVTEKSATGCTADMGAFFSSLSKLAGNNKRDAAMLYQLGASLGSSTMKITYESDGVQCRGDLLFK